MINNRSITLDIVLVLPVKHISLSLYYKNVGFDFSQPFLAKYYFPIILIPSHSSWQLLPGPKNREDPKNQFPRAQIQSPTSTRTRGFAPACVRAGTEWPNWMHSGRSTRSSWRSVIFYCCFYLTHVYLSQSYEQNEEFAKDYRI